VSNTSEWQQDLLVAPCTRLWLDAFRG